jgi:hypothetical protein
VGNSNSKDGAKNQIRPHFSVTSSHRGWTHDRYSEYHLQAANITYIITMQQEANFQSPSLSLKSRPYISCANKAEFAAIIVDSGNNSKGATSLLDRLRAVEGTRYGHNSQGRGKGCVDGEGVSKNILHVVNDKLQHMFAKLSLLALTGVSNELYTTSRSTNPNEDWELMVSVGYSVGVIHSTISVFLQSHLHRLLINSAMETLEKMLQHERSAEESSNYISSQQCKLLSSLQSCFLTLLHILDYHLQALSMAMFARDDCGIVSLCKQTQHTRMIMFEMFNLLAPDDLRAVGLLTDSMVAGNPKSVLASLISLEYAVVSEPVLQDYLPTTRRRNNSMNSAWSTAFKKMDNWRIIDQLLHKLDTLRAVLSTKCSLPQPLSMYTMDTHASSSENGMSDFTRKLFIMNANQPGHVLMPLLQSGVRSSGTDNRSMFATECRSGELETSYLKFIVLSFVTSSIAEPSLYAIQRCMFSFVENNFVSMSAPKLTDNDLAEALQLSADELQKHTLKSGDQNQLAPSTYNSLSASIQSSLMWFSTRLMLFERGSVHKNRPEPNPLSETSNSRPDSVLVEGTETYLEDCLRLCLGDSVSLFLPFQEQTESRLFGVFQLVANKYEAVRELCRKLSVDVCTPEGFVHPVADIATAETGTERSRPEARGKVPDAPAPQDPAEDVSIRTKPAPLVTSTVATPSAPLDAAPAQNVSMSAASLSFFADPKLVGQASSDIISKYAHMMTAQVQYEQKIRWSATQLRTLRVRRAKLRAQRVDEIKHWANELKMKRLQAVSSRDRAQQGPQSTAANQNREAEDWTGPAGYVDTKKTSVKVSHEPGGPSSLQLAGEQTAGTEPSSGLHEGKSSVRISQQPGGDSSVDGFLSGYQQDHEAQRDQRSSVRVTHEPGGHSSVSLVDSSLDQVPVGLDEHGKSSVRVAHAPGGESSIDFGGTTQIDGLDEHGKSSVRVMQAPGGESSIEFGQAEQMEGLGEHGKSSVRVTHAPGGRSSIDLTDAARADVPEQGRSSVRITHQPGGNSSIDLSDGLSSASLATAGAARPDMQDLHSVGEGSKAFVRISQAPGGTSSIDLSHPDAVVHQGAAPIGSELVGDAMERSSVRVSQQPGGRSTIDLTDGLDHGTAGRKVATTAAAAIDDADSTADTESTKEYDVIDADDNFDSDSDADTHSTLTDSDQEDDKDVDQAVQKKFPAKIERLSRRADTAAAVQNSQLPPQPVGRPNPVSTGIIDAFISNSRKLTELQEQQALKMCTLTTALVDLASRAHLLSVDTSTGRKQIVLARDPILTMASRSLLQLIHMQCKLVDQILLLLMLLPQVQEKKQHRPEQDLDDEAMAKVAVLPRLFQRMYAGPSRAIHSDYNFGNTLFAHLDAVHDLFLLSARSNYIANFSTAIVELYVGNASNTFTVFGRDKVSVDMLLQIQQQKQLQQRGLARTLTNTKLKSIVGNAGVNELDEDIAGKSSRTCWTDQLVLSALRQTAQVSVVSRHTVAARGRIFLKTAPKQIGERPFVANTVFSVAGIAGVNIQYNSCPWPMNVLLGTDSDAQGLLNGVIVKSTRRLIELNHCVACVRLVFTSLHNAYTDFDAGEISRQNSIRKSSSGKEKKSPRAQAQPAHRQRFDKYAASSSSSRLPLCSPARLKSIDKQRKNVCVYHIQQVVNALLAYAFNRISVTREWMQRDIITNGVNEGIAGVSNCIVRYAARLSKALFVLDASERGDDGDSRGLAVLHRIGEGISTLLHACRACLCALYECNAVNSEVYRLQSGRPSANSARVVFEDTDEADAKELLIQTLEQRACYYDMLLDQSLKWLHEAKTELMNALSDSQAQAQYVEDSEVLLTYLGQV